MMRRLLPPTAALAVLLCAPVAHAAGTVTVRSDMAGQSVMVDGADIGMITPASVQGLSAGPHIVRVVGGCRVGEARVEVVDGETVPVLVETRRTPGSLALEIAPAGAEVRVDGEVLSSWREPQALDCGAHTVSVAMPGHLPTLINVDIEAGGILTLPITLVPQGRGKLTLDVTPDDARVLLDGAEIGTGDLSRFAMLAGPHMLRAEAEGYEAGERQFVLEDGADLSIELPLTALPGTVVAAAPAPAAPAQPTPAAPVGPAGPGWSKARITGVSLTAVGAGVGVLAAVQLSRMATYGKEYQSRADEVLATNDATVLAPAYANDYRSDTLLPQRNRAVTSTALATALLASGVTLTVAF